MAAGCQVQLVGTQRLPDKQVPVGIGGQQHGGRRDLVGLPDAAEGEFAQLAGDPLGRIGGKHAGIHRSGRDAVDVDAPFAHLPGERLGKGDDSRLCRAVVGGVDAADLP